MGGELGERRKRAKGCCNSRCAPRCNGAAPCPGNGGGHQGSNYLRGAALPRPARSTPVTETRSAEVGLSNNVSSR